MRDVKMKPINIEPVKIILLMGLASAVMGLSACNKSDSDKTAQTANIASVSSEDVNIPDQVAEQIPEQITEQITEQGETPMTQQGQGGRDDSAAQSEVRSMAECRALALKSEKLACMIDVRDALRAKNAAQEAEEKALDAQSAALDAGLAEDAKEKAAQEARIEAKKAEIAALDAELAEQAKENAALDAQLAAVKAENEQKRIMIEVLTKVKEAMEDAE